MACLTPLPFADALRLARHFGIELAQVDALKAGSVNSNFKLTSTTGQNYFARIYEEQGELGARREAALLDALHVAGVPVVQALQPPDPGPLPGHAGKPFGVFPWLDADILCQARVTPEACEKVGRSLARVHAATATLSEIPEGRFNTADLLSRLEMVERAERTELFPAVELIRYKLQEYAVPRAEVPQGLIHGDLFRDNVLWQNGEIAALIDFESAARGSFIYDLMVTILAWCYGSAFDLALVSGLLRGYASIREVSAAEILELPRAGALACLRFASTRLTDYSLRVPAGTAPVRSYARFLERLSALEAGKLEPAFQDSLKGIHP